MDWGTERLTGATGDTVFVWCGCNGVDSPSGWSVHMAPRPEATTQAGDGRTILYALRSTTTPATPQDLHPRGAEEDEEPKRTWDLQDCSSNRQ